MHKIMLIVRREYFMGIRNTSFKVITIVAPLIFAIIFKLFDKPVDLSIINDSLLLFISIFSSILIYFVVFFYSIRTMQGVIEEKSNRIIEIIISSVKPFQLLTGKIIGITAIVFTQVISWIILTVVFTYTINTFESKQLVNDTKASYNNVKELNSHNDNTPVKNNKSLSSAIVAIPVADLAIIVFSFLFYLLGGFILYAALYAAIGAAVDSSTDTMQFMIPVTSPLIFALLVVPSVFKNPDNDIAFWTSLIPFTSPVVMMMRIPFGVPLWQIVLSIVLLIAGILFTTFIAAKIYRIGILMHGTKINLKMLRKWLLS
jgi:ABC-2 type transport system permease protein